MANNLVVVTDADAADDASLEELEMNRIVPTQGDRPVSPRERNSLESDRLQAAIGEPAEFLRSAKKPGYGSRHVSSRPRSALARDPWALKRDVEDRGRETGDGNGGRKAGVRRSWSLVHGRLYRRGEPGVCSNRDSYGH